MDVDCPVDDGWSYWAWREQRAANKPDHRRVWRWFFAASCADCCRCADDGAADRLWHTTARARFVHRLLFARRHAHCERDARRQSYILIHVWRRQRERSANLILRWIRLPSVSDARAAARSAAALPAGGHDLFQLVTPTRHTLRRLTTHLLPCARCTARYKGCCEYKRRGGEALRPLWHPLPNIRSLWRHCRLYARAVGRLAKSAPSARPTDVWLPC